MYVLTPAGPPFLQLYQSTAAAAAAAAAAVSIHSDARPSLRPSVRRTYERKEGRKERDCVLTFLRKAERQPASRTDGLTEEKASERCRVRPAAKDFPMVPPRTNERTNGLPGCH